jgi:hypothetical protein
MGSPIAVMEGAFGSAPWVKHAGWLAVPAVLFVIGATAIFGFSALYGFMASWPQLLVSALIAIALVVVALLLPRRAAGAEAISGYRASTFVGARKAAGYWMSVVVAFALGAVVQMSYEYLRDVSPWLSVAGLAIGIACGILFAVLARPDATGLGTGAILTYCVVGLVNAAGTGSTAVIEQVALVVIALAVLTLVAVRHLRGAGRAASNIRGVRSDTAAE